MARWVEFCAVNQRVPCSILGQGPGLGEEPGPLLRAVDVSEAVNLCFSGTWMSLSLISLPTSL